MARGPHLRLVSARSSGLCPPLVGSDTNSGCQSQNCVVEPTPLPVAGETEHGHELLKSQHRTKILVDLILKLKAIMNFRGLFSRPSKKR